MIGKLSQGRLSVVRKRGMISYKGLALFEILQIVNQSLNLK